LSWCYLKTSGGEPGFSRNEFTSDPKDWAWEAGGAGEEMVDQVAKLALGSYEKKMLAKRV